MSERTPEETLARWLNGSLSDEEAAEVEELVSSDEVWRRALNHELETIEMLSLAFTPAARPTPRCRGELLKSVDGINRFDDLTSKVASLIDRAEAFAGDLLGRIDRPESWEHSPFPGVELFHIEGGPAVADAIVGFVKIGPGGEFPEHRHLGKEHKLVLQGAFREGDGTTYRRGQVCSSDPETHHELHAVEGEPPLIYLVVLHEGLDIAGMIIGPGDARV